FVSCFFFFQAEDGIRDFHVTGVQTCALPIFEVKTVDPRNFTAWIQGKFDFSNKPLRGVLDEIANWYDIDIIYQGPVPDVELTGEAYRNSDFKLILRLLEVAKIDYDLDVKQRKLTIK